VKPLGARLDKQFALALMDRPEWVREAECAKHPDPDLWHREEDSQSVCEAKLICLYKCRVREACLADALSSNAPSGVWGGVTSAQRRSYQRRARLDRQVKR
jgi:WhiB family transcriptional regulator, redox-sensing transcriptional regulator